MSPSDGACDATRRSAIETAFGWNRPPARGLDRRTHQNLISSGHSSRAKSGRAQGDTLSGIRGKENRILGETFQRLLLAHRKHSSCYRLESALEEHTWAVYDFVRVVQGNTTCACEQKTVQ